MILQSLAEYYIRESCRKQSRIAPYGMAKEKISFLIEIDEDGNFVNFIDIREGNKGKEYLVPKRVSRSGTNSWKKANLLWDNYGYVLGQPGYDKTDRNAAGKLGSFIARLESLPDDLKRDRKIAAVIKFYRGGGIKELLKHENWFKCSRISSKCDITFQMYDEAVPVTENNMNLRKWIASATGVDGECAESAVIGRCLVSGETAPIARIHAKVGIGREQATLVGFQKDSGYDSYGKEQGYNAPVSEKSEFFYTTALKTLLDSRNNRIQMGNTVLLFWALPRGLSEETVSETETGVKCICNISGNDVSDNANAGVINARNIFESIFTGRIPNDAGDRFCVLGLSPNKARISVVFWKNGSIREIAGNIMQYLDDVDICRNADKREPCLADILRSSEYEGKIEKVPSNMIPALIYSVFNRAAYPSALFGHIMSRVRSERMVTYHRAAFIKAYLNRKYKNKKGAVIKVSLDRENKDPAYRLGRLFAVLEKIQAYANPGINSTIRDRYYSSMSSAPSSVLPVLIRLKNHHLEKLSPGRRIYFEQEIQEIMSGIQPETMPKYLSLEEQGYFAIGYYHESDFIYAKKENKGEDI